MLNAALVYKRDNQTNIYVDMEQQALIDFIAEKTTLTVTEAGTLVRELREALEQMARVKR